MKISTFFPAVLVLLFSCELERNVTVELPVYERQLVVEAYLERAAPLRVTVTESDPYFDSLRFPVFNQARVRFFQDEREEILPNIPTIDPVARKYYNYIRELPADPDEKAIFRLVVEDGSGRRLEGRTRFLPPPRLDSVEVRYRNPPGDSAASLLVWISDFPGESNYYRIIINEDSLNGGPAVEFTFTDAGQDGARFPVGTGFRFRPGKTAFIRLFHLEQGYFQYLRSMGSASNANGNPFAQPATVSSPMKGDGYGVFATLNYRQVVKKL